MKKKEKQQEPGIIQAEKPVKKSHKKRNIIIAVAVLCVISLFVDEPDDAAVSSAQPDAVAASGSKSESKTVPEPKHVNIFMDATMQERPIMNGIKTEKIGEYARITISKEKAKSAPMEDFVEFANQKVSSSGDKYNYWIIDFAEDDSVIYFVGDDTGFAFYYNYYSDDRGITDLIGTATATFDENDNVTGYVYESTVGIDE